jgi:hypothetical protein
MPNGESKNWIRFQVTLESFHSIYGHWPSVINLYPFFIEELKDKLSRQDFETVQSKISLVPDEEHPFLAMDDSGNVYDYCHGFKRDPSQSTEKAVDWLSVDKPHYYD